jgi:diguanylate cyclase (GGDEF)-like protein
MNNKPPARTIKKTLPHPEDPMQPRALRADGLSERLLPFALPALLGFIPLLFPADREQGVDMRMVVLAILLSLLCFASAFIVPWHRLPRETESFPPLIYIAVVFLMREATDHDNLIFTPLLLLPLFWFSLHGTRHELLAAFIVTIVIDVFVTWFRGGSAGIIQAQFLAILVSPVICFTTQSLMQHVRLQAIQLSSQALTDGLTGIPNRRAWDEELPRMLSRALRYEQPICIAICDLDHFKAWNDTKGHQAGDALLQQVAIYWRKVARDSDFLARYGGEEFALLLPACTEIGAMNVLKRLQASIPGGQTCSVGVARWDRKETALALVERADRALYDAKKNGRDRIHLAAQLDSQPIEVSLNAEAEGEENLALQPSGISS